MSLLTPTPVRQGRPVRPRSSSLIVVPMRTGDTMFAECTSELFFPAMSLDVTQPTLDEIISFKERSYALYIIRVQDTPESADVDGPNSAPIVNNIEDTVPEVIQQIFDKIDVSLEITSVNPATITPAGLPVISTSSAATPHRSSSIKQSLNHSRKSSLLNGPQNTLSAENAPSEATLGQNLRFPGISGIPGIPESKEDDVKIFEKAYDHMDPPADVYRTFGYHDGRWCLAFIFSASLEQHKAHHYIRNLETVAVISKERDAGNPKTPRLRPSAEMDGPLLDSIITGFLDCVAAVEESAEETPQTFSRKSSKCDSITGSLPMRIIKHRQLGIRNAMTLKVTTNWTSLLENTLLLSVELGNDKSAEHTFRLFDISFAILNSVVNFYGSPVTKEDPILLKPGECFSLLYHVKLLDDTLGIVPRNPLSSDKNPHASILAAAPASSSSRDVVISIHGVSFLASDQHISDSKTLWHFQLDVSDQEKRRVQELFRSGSGSRSTVVFPPRAIQKEETQRHPSIIRSDTSGPNQVLSSGDRKFSLSRTLLPAAGPDRTPSPQPLDLGVQPRRGSDASISTTSTTTSTTPSRKYSYLPPQMRRKAGTIVGSAPPPVAEPTFGGGVVVSFSVTGRVQQGKVFAVEALLVNRSRKTKTYTVMVPSRQRGTRKPSGSVYKPHQKRASECTSEKLSPSDIVNKYVENQKNEASLLCLDTNVKLAALQPGSCQLVHLHFLPMHERFNPIELVQLFDNETGAVTSLRDVLEVYVHPQSEVLSF